MKNIEELIDMLFRNINNELSSDDMIACVLTRDADMYLEKVKRQKVLSYDEIKRHISENNNNNFDYWAALALHVDKVYDKLDKETQYKYKEIFSIVAGHALKHQTAVNSIFKSVIEHKDINKESKLDKFTLDELEAELKRRKNAFNKKP